MMTANPSHLVTTMNFYSSRTTSIANPRFICGHLQIKLLSKFPPSIVHERTYVESHDKFSIVRSNIWMPLHKIDKLTELFINRGWVQPTKRVRLRQHLCDRTQLLMMAVLKVLGNRRPFCQFKIQTEFSIEEQKISRYVQK